MVPRINVFGLRSEPALADACNCNCGGERASIASTGSLA